MVGIARGMLALHRQQMVHRDLKSLNILLDDELYTKVCDFGIARFLGEHEVGCTKNVGTPHWMAPEIFESRAYTSKVDVYAFGMLVWEMLTEGVPFKGKDGFQVAIAVARNRERPPLPEDGPRDLRDFIALCWDHEPSVRPTFSQIVRKLCQGLVLFGVDNADSVFEFLAKIPLSRQELTDLFSPDESASAAFEARFPDQPDFPWHEMAVAEGVTSPVDLSNEPLGRSSGRRVDHIDSQESDVSALFDGEVSRDFDETTDPKPPVDEWSMNYLRSLSPADAHDTFRRLLEQQRRELPDVISRLLLSRPDFAGAVVRSGVLAALPLTSEAMFDANVRILIVMAQEKPGAVTADTIRLLMTHSGRASGAQRLLKFLSVFIRTAHDNPQAGLIAQQFLEHANAFIDIPEFAPLLLELYRNQAFDILRPEILAALSSGLLEKDVNVATACFAAFCAVPFTIRDIPVSELIARASDGLFPVKTIELFARLPQLPVSTRLISALVTVGGKSPLTTHCLCRLALTLKGAQAVLALPGWMEPECLSIHDSVVLVLVICRFAEARDTLVDITQFPDFLMKVLREGTPKEIEGIALVLRKMRTTESFLRVLDGKGFFADYLPRALESRIPVLQDGALLLVAAYARIGWVNGFFWFMQYLPALIGTGGALSKKSIIVTLLLSAHPQAKGAIRQLNLAPIVADCDIDDASSTYRDRLLGFVRA
jgi:hypothetical protein